MKRRETGERPDFLNSDLSYDLLVPIDYSVGGEAQTLSRLPLRRLRAAELLMLDEPLVWTEKLLRVIEAMTGQLRVVTVKLDAVDLDRIDDILGYFREPGSVTGAISLPS